MATARPMHGARTRSILAFNDPAPRATGVLRESVKDVRGVERRRAVTACGNPTHARSLRQCQRFALSTYEMESSQ